METVQAIANEPKLDGSLDYGAAARAVDWDNPRVASILSAAAKCFARRGFHTTTLAEIGKELGLRKSIVHYYFTSKAALVQEVQSFTYKLTLRGIREALSPQGPSTQSAQSSLGTQGSLGGQGSSRSLEDALGALWKCVHDDTIAKGLNVEIWSAMRQDPEIRRRAALLNADARTLLVERLKPHFSDADGIATLTLAVLDGLAVAEAIDGDSKKTRRAFDAFVHLVSSSQARSTAA